MATLNDEYDQLLRALMPSGPAWEGDHLVMGFAPALARVHSRANDLMREISPADTVELIDRYEGLCGLPDECIPDGVQTLTQRQRRLDAKINEEGGIHADYYLSQLRALGYDNVTITQYQYADPDKPETWPDGAKSDTFRFYWRVNFPANADIDVMTCVDGCNSFLRTWGDTVAECVIHKNAPSHTIVLFAYPDE